MIGYRTKRRSGFTLVELIVSIAVLIGLMAMVGVIFATATTAATTGTATMSVQRRLRMARKIILHDLANFDPAEGALAVYGWEQLAYASADDRQSGRALNETRGNNYRPPNRDYHRADVLFLTPRMGATPYGVRAPKVTGEYLLVTYGHADFAVLDDRGTADPGDDAWPTATTAFQRVNNPPTANDIGNDPSIIAGGSWHLARQAIVGTAAATGFSNEVTDGGCRGTTVSASLQGINNADYIRMTRAGRENAGNGEPGADFLYDVPLDDLLATWASATTGIENRLYFLGTGPNRRMLCDPAVTLAQRGRMAYHFLPACTEFRVEVTYDTPEMIWPHYGIGQPPTNWFTIPSGYRAEWVRGEYVNKAEPREVTDAPPDKWRNVIRNGTAQGAYRLLVNPATGLADPIYTPQVAPDPDDPPFPTAIRITLRVFDDNQTLFEPRFDAQSGDLSSDGAVEEVIVYRF